MVAYGLVWVLMMFSNRNNLKNKQNSTRGNKNLNVGCIESKAFKT